MGRTAARLVAHQEVTERKLAEVARTENDASCRPSSPRPGVLGVVEIEGEDLRYVVVNASSAATGSGAGSLAGRRASEVGVPG